MMLSLKNKRTLVENKKIDVKALEDEGAAAVVSVDKVVLIGLLHQVMKIVSLLRMRRTNLQQDNPVEVH